MSGTPSPFANRLGKNARHLRKWARRDGLTAYRLYDRDMPEYPFAVDWYDGRVQLSEFPRPRALRSGEAERLRAEVLTEVQQVLEVPSERIFLKTHVPKKWGQEQYERQGAAGEPFVVEEQGLRFWVELGAYLDTGLFLDHRLTRAMVRKDAQGTRFLNLFAYTGSFSVYAAAGEARSTTTVDLSRTYLDWAARNFSLNGFKAVFTSGNEPGPERDGVHRLVRADARAWLREAAARTPGSYDLIVLDPPSFSTSKAMSGSFDIQRDHVALLEDTLALLSPGGSLYFSTNFQGFALDETLAGRYAFEELTPRSLPPDFQQRAIHRCWRVRLGASATRR